MRSTPPHGTRTLIATAAALLLVGLVPAPASAAEPTIASLSPADGAVSATADPTLSATVSDPDGGPLDVTFEGRRKGATTGGSGAPFTVVALPDIQNYTNRTRGPMIAQQTTWIADQRAAMNTQFVVQLGDLVASWDFAGHWPWASDGLKVLEDRRVPYAIVPGNHDFDNATGAFTEYDRWFPVSRLANAARTPSTASYGGYMGQDQFGDDPVDRRNMNNYSLFSAGGVDWLVLGLEWEAPAVALAWADRVLAAHPDRQVIMFTHSFLNLDGTRRTVPQRPGGTPQETLWRDFVRTHCQVRMVLSGHENKGDLGEARRTDANACGKPVHQMLSNYQSRPNGGDGWLRTYRFDPAAGTVTADTYSPILDRHETDADSAFTLPFEFPATEPAPFTPVATVRAQSGETVDATWAGLERDTEYEWRVRVSDGTSTTTSPVRTVRTPPPVSVGPVAEDAFGRTVTSGWGAAEKGGTWSVQGKASQFAVGGGVGQHVLTAGTEAQSSLASGPARDVELRLDLAWSRPASQGVLWTRLIPRAVTARDDYRLTLNVGTAGRPRLDLTRRSNGVDTVLRSVQAPGVTIAANTPYTTVVRTVTSGGTTTLSAKIFPAGTAEPDWQATVTDSTPSLQAPGGLALSTYSSSSSTAPVTTRFDNLTLRPVAP